LKDERMNYKFTWEKSGICVRFFGKISKEDLCQAQADFHENERFEEQEYAIWDLSECDASEIKENDLNILIAHHLGANYTLPTHLSTIIAHDSHVKVLSEKFITACKSHGSKWDIRGFKMESEARNWIDR